MRSRFMRVSSIGLLGELMRSLKASSEAENMKQYPCAPSSRIKQTNCVTGFVEVLGEIPLCDRVMTLSNWLIPMNNHIKNLSMPLFLMGCLWGIFKRENGPLRHVGKRPIKVGKRPIKEGKRPMNADGQFSGTAAWWKRPL